MKGIRGYNNHKYTTNISKHYKKDYQFNITKHTLTDFKVESINKFSSNIVFLVVISDFLPLNLHLRNIFGGVPP